MKNRRDWIIMIVAILLAGGMLWIGAQGDLLKEKLGIKKAGEFNQSPQGPDALQTGENYPSPENLNYSTSSESILVSSPFPNEIIKGSILVIKGEARVFENIVNIEIKDKESGELWLATTTLAAAPDIGQFGVFEKKVDLVRNSGWAVMNIFSLSAKDGSIINLVSFPIRISPSI